MQGISTNKLRDINQMGSLHCGLDQPIIQTEVLGHSLVCLLVRSHRSLTACSALLASLSLSAALTHLLACSLRSLLSSLDSD